MIQDLKSKKNHQSSIINHQSTLLGVLSLGLVILVFYGNTLQNGFVHDDVWQVAQNSLIKNISNLPQVFSSCVAEDLLGGCENIGFYYRPLQPLLYMLISQINQAPWIFHLANLGLVFLTGVAVYKLFSLLFKDRLLAFAGGLIFIAHPINSEVVNWISATPEILSALFLLLTLIFYELFLQKGKRFLLVLSAGSFFLSLMSKETAVFYLPLLILPAFFNNFKPGMKQLLNLAWFLTPLLIYLGIRFEVLGRLVYKYEGYYNLNLASQIFTALSLFPQYLLKLVFPYPLSFQQQIPPVLEYDNIVTLGFITLTAVLALVYYLYQKREKNLLIGLGLILLGILPALVFVNKLGENLFSERYLFIPSIGLALIIVSLVQKNFKLFNPKVWPGILVVYLLTGLVIVFPRNSDWKDNFASYQAMTRIDSNNKKAHLMLGNIHRESGRGDVALQEYQEALKIDPEYIEAKNAIDLLTKRYQAKVGLSFYYPGGWSMEEEAEQVVIKDPKGEFLVELSKKTLDENQTVDDLINEASLSGELKNQGLAKIPNFTQAFVKVYEIEGKPKLQFFLMEGKNVIEVIVYPSDSALMREFDKILGSITISDL